MDTINLHEPELANISRRSNASNVSAYQKSTQAVRKDVMKTKNNRGFVYNVRWKTTALIALIFAIVILLVYICVHNLKEYNFMANDDNRDLIYYIDQTKRTARSLPNGHMIINY
jgi:hypothetical protein